MPTFNFVRFVVRPTERPSDPLLPNLPALGHCAPDSAKILAQSRQSRSGQTGPHCVRRFIGAPFRCNSFFQHFWGQSNWLAAVKQLALGLLISGCSCCCCWFCYCCTRVTVAAAAEPATAAEPADCNSCKLQVATVLAFVLAKVHQNRVSHRAINQLANQSIKPSIK